MTDQLAQIRERAAKATKGPWSTRTVVADVPSGKWYEAFHVVDKIKYGLFGMERVGGKQWQNDIDFAAHSRTDIPFLLDKLATIRAETLEECCKAVCSRCKSGSHPIVLHKMKWMHHIVTKSGWYSCQATAIRDAGRKGL